MSDEQRLVLIMLGLAGVALTLALVLLQFVGEGNL